MFSVVLRLTPIFLPALTKWFTRPANAPATVKRPFWLSAFEPYLDGDNKYARPIRVVMKTTASHQRRGIRQRLSERPKNIRRLDRTQRETLLLRQHLRQEMFTALSALDLRSGTSPRLMIGEVNLRWRVTGRVRLGYT